MLMSALAVCEIANAQGTFTAESQYTVTMSDGSTTDWSGELNFVQEEDSDDVWAISTSDEYSSDLDVSGISSISINSLQTRYDAYESPTYPDYYRSFSDWEDRDSWNLANVHDPTVMRAEDGYYYMYQTDASFGNAHSGHGHFFCRRSQNLVEWEFMGATMQALPSWVPEKLNEIRTAMGVGESTEDLTDEDNFGFWAPCARMVEPGLYRMYYCITCPGTIDGTSNSWSERCFIGLMETSDPSDVDSWEDKGYVITNASDKGLNYNVTEYEDCYFKWNAIDPSYIITPEGEHWLIYGSWHSGIAAVQIDPETGKTLEELGDPWGEGDDEIAEYGTLIYSRDLESRWQASEGPEVVYHDGYYYLFLAYDALEVPYNTRVCRSTSITGPYYDIRGNNVTDEGGVAYPIATHPYKFSSGYGWVGISHCAVFDDGNGNWYYSSQARLPEGAYDDDSSNAIMQGQVRKILWDSDGWPVVMPECYSKVPQVDITADDLVGEWDFITISYSYGNQQEAFELHLNSDCTISSDWNDGSSWSFDESTQMLTIAGVEMQVMRETDWEQSVSVREPTIIFAGYNTNGRTYWGKRLGDDEGDDFTYIIDDELTTVGETDCSTGWWSAFSSYYRIPSEGTLKLNFTNYTGGEDNWDNYLIVLTNDYDRDESGYAEYIVLRADYYGWGDSYDSNNLSGSGFDWDTFTSVMNGAEVEITVERDGSTVTITCDCDCNDGSETTQTLTAECGDGTQVIRAFLTVESGYLDNISSSFE